MIHINLIPKSVQIEHRRRKHTKRWIVACLCSAIVVALPWCYDRFNQMKAESISKENQQTLTTLHATQLQLQNLKQIVHDAELKLRRANSLRQKRPWSGMMTLIATAMPARSWIISIATIPEIPSASGRRSARMVSQSVKKSGNKTVTIEAPRKLKIVGYAVDASEPMLFVSKLKAFGVFDNVILQRSYLEPVEDGKYFRFELVCEW